MAERSFAKVGVKGRPYTIIIISILVLLLCLVSVFGLKLGDKTIIPGAGDIRFGIDIRGGVEAIFTPKDFEGKPTAEQMDAASRIIAQRLDNQQILDRDVIVGRDSDRITVRFPWRSDETDFNPEEALLELGEMALLTFREPDGTVALTGADVKQARYGLDSTTNTPIIHLELKDEGKERFADVTTRLSEHQEILYIFMDEDIISAPAVSVPILDGDAVISGNFTVEYANDLAQKINAGALPFALEASSSSTISPSLGQEALRVMTISGIVALLLICIFMLVYYRLPGFAACISLLTQVAGILLAISIPQQTLTLQGIAGIILSIGMGVDANVIVAERIKEELNDSSNLSLALSNGFKRAFSSVFDGNVTVAIAAVMLMVFGSGTTLSFGYSLLVGVILNGITGVWMTRLMIGSLASFKRFQNPRLYGKKKESAIKGGINTGKSFSYCKNIRYFIILSSILLFTGVLVSVTGGIKLDIDFRGGSIVNYSYEGDIDLEEAGSLVKDELGREVSAQMIVSIADERSEISLNIAGNKSMTPEELDQINKILDQAFPDADITLSSSQLVDPLIGRETLFNGVKAILLASVLIIIYIWFSFRSMSGPSAGVMAMLALLHDILGVFFFAVLIGNAINETIIAVMLTILGYSINDTIVVYDRIRENIGLTGGIVPLDELVDKSIQQSLTRSVNTSLATFMAVTVAYIFGHLYNISSITEFALPMMFGIIIGAYSSLFLSGPLWVRWKQRGGKTGYHSGAKAVALLLTLLMSLSVIAYPGVGVQALTVTTAAAGDIVNTESQTANENVTAPENETSPDATSSNSTSKPDGTQATTSGTVSQTETRTTEDQNSLKSRWPEIEQVKAKAYVVVDASNMKILAEHNAHTRRPMASTTKILTALTVINHPDFDLDRIVTVSKEATVLPSSISARVGLMEGEKLTTEECLYGLMVHSGNDCANVLAENYSPAKSGTALERRNAFCEEATKYAHSLGAKDTSIKNPSGFTVEGHYSTAYDLALLAQTGLQDEIFSRLVSTSFYRMPATNKHPVAGWKILCNTNGLVLSSPELYGSQYFKSYDGVKTGTTSLAGKCLVGAGTTHDNRQIIAALLDADLTVDGSSLTIDIFMRALLEEGAEKLGVEPIREDLGTSGQGFSAQSDEEEPVIPEQTEAETEETEDSTDTTKPTDSDQKTLTTDTVPTAVHTDETHANSGLFSGDLSNVSLIVLGILMLALLAILLFLGFSIRKDKRKQKYHKNKNNRDTDEISRD